MLRLDDDDNQEQAADKPEVQG
jgi:hypothetical protein